MVHLTLGESNATRSRRYDFFVKIGFAILPIFRTKSDNWFCSLLLTRVLRLSCPLSFSALLWPSRPLPSNVGMQLLNAASAPPFSRWWKIRARRRLRRLNLCHLSARPWLLDLSASLHLRKQEQEEISAANERSFVFEVLRNNERKNYRIDFLLLRAVFFSLLPRTDIGGWP